MRYPTMANYILEDNINYIINESKKEDISEEEIISLYGNIIERPNEHLRYHKFGLREEEIAILRTGSLKDTKFEGFNYMQD